MPKRCGAKIYLKREDLNHTGAHKINNVLGQALLAKRMGKTRLIAETGAGQHGVATATAASLLGMECVVFMGEEDTIRQALNVYRMRLLGAEEPVGEVNALFLNREEHFRQAVDEVLEGHRSRQVLQMNGRCCQLLADPVWKDGEPAGAVLVLMDVTEQEKREELRREFTANVSHELKTPLTAISGIAEIMQGGMVKPEDIRDFAGDIYQEARRLIALVEDILRLSQLDEGAESLEREPVELLALSQEVARRLEPAARSAGVSVEVCGAPVQVQGVRRVLDEMIYNLCENAIKYNRTGGRVTLTVGQGAEGPEVTVADTGIGIPPEDQSRVFERFYRVDKSHSKEIGGTGLGLSIVKHGALLHNAQIYLNSQVDRGTSIRISFPK